jgi:hypothetical protein
MIGPIILAVCLTSMVFVFWRSFGQRARAMRVIAGPLSAGAINDAVAGSAAQIADGGVVPSKVLLGALSWRHQQDEDFELPDEGTGNLLGLVYHRFKHLSDTWWEPTVYDGVRSGRQVWIRLGRQGTSIRGPGLNARRLRTMVVVRAAVGPFEAVAEHGRLRVVSGGGAELDALFGGFATSPDVWHDVRIVGGPDGLAASRAVVGDYLGGWVYDLWLLEHLAAKGNGRPLDAVELGREFTPPYDLGSWAPSLADSVAAT